MTSARLFIVLGLLALAASGAVADKDKCETCKELVNATRQVYMLIRQRLRCSERWGCSI